MYLGNHYFATLGSLYSQFGLISEAVDSYEMALQVCTQAQNHQERGQLLNRLGELRAQLGEYSHAQILFSDAIQCCQSSQTSELARDMILPLRNLGMIQFHHRNCPSLAIKYLRQSLDYSEMIEDDLNTAITLGYLGQVYVTQQQYCFSLCCYEAALDIFRNLEGQSANHCIVYRAALMLCGIAQISQQTNHLEFAIEHYLEALDRFESLNCSDDIGWLLRTLGTLYESLGQFSTALHYHQRAQNELTFAR